MVTGFISWFRNGETAGAGREADLMDEIFPFEITYTVQKSGAPFDTFPGISAVLNLLWGNSFQSFVRKLQYNSIKC